MFDPSGPSQLGGQTRLWVLPGIDQERAGFAELAPGRVLIARVLEVRGSEAVLAWGRHRLVARAELPLAAGARLTLRVQGAEQGVVRLGLVGGDSRAGAALPLDARGELLMALRLVDDPRNRAIVAGLARSGQAVTAAEVRAVRQAMVHLGAMDEDAAAVIWLRQAQLPLSQPALQVARSLVQHEPSTGLLWQTLWWAVREQAWRTYTVRRLAERLPLVRLDPGEPAALVAALRYAIASAATPTERKLARTGDVKALREDARTVLTALRHHLQRDGALSPDLDRALTALQDRLEARQLANATADGVLRLDLPLIIDDTIRLATLTITGQPAGRQPDEARSSEARATLQVDLDGLGRVEVDLVRRGTRLFCWLSTENERSYRLVQAETRDIVQRLEAATGWSVEARWFLSPPAQAAAPSLETIDLRT